MQTTESNPIVDPIVDPTLRRDFADADHWAELAKKCYIRLPIWNTAATPEKMRFWLRKFRVTEAEYLNATGYKALQDFMRLNPDWPLRAWLGLLLEYVNERDEARGILRAYER